MIISEFYDYVRQLTRANSRDLTDSDIEILANPEADYLYELSIQAYHLEQTAVTAPTVLTYVMTTSFQATDHNLWIERVEVSIDGGDSFYQIQKTNKTDYNLEAAECGGLSLTDQLAVTDSRPTHFIQTSEGINVFPMAASVTTNIYVKDTPVIDWANPNFEILLPNVPINLLALKTALMYRDINDTNQLQFLQSQYNDKFEVFQKRLAKGGRVIQMHQVTKDII